MKRASRWEKRPGKKTRLFALPFHTKNDHFTKTGSGQTQGNSQKSTVFLQTLVNFARKARPGFNFTSIQVNKNYLSVRKTPLFAPFVYKTNILPRQARDKHRESTQKRVAFFAGDARRQQQPRTEPHRRPRCEETPFLEAIFY